MMHNGVFGSLGYGGMGLHLLFLILIIVAAVYLYRKMDKTRLAAHFSNDKTTTETNEALEILRERYARGEIDTEEFQKIKEVLIK